MPLPTKISEPEIDPTKLRILIYGATKTGKSTFASRVEDVLLLPIDPGLKAIRGFKYDPTGQNRPDAMITKWSEVIQAYEELRTQDHPFKAVCFDTIDNCFRLCVEHMLKDMGIKHESDMGYGKGYSLINNEFMRVIKLFDSLPMGQIYCCHEAVFTMETRTGKTEKMVPDLPKGPRGRIMRDVDFILYTFLSESEEVDEDGNKKQSYFMGTAPTANYDAGYRFSSMLNWPAVLRTNYPAFLKRFKADMAAANGKKNPATFVEQTAINGGTSPAEQPDATVTQDASKKIDGSATTIKDEPKADPKPGTTESKSTGPGESVNKPETKPDTKTAAKK